MILTFRHHCHIPPNLPLNQFRQSSVDDVSGIGLCREYQMLVGHESKSSWGQTIYGRGHIKCSIAEHVWNEYELCAGDWTFRSKEIKGKSLAEILLVFNEGDINNYVNACDICARNKPQHKTPKAPLEKIGVGAPMDRLATDIIGPCRSEYDLNNSHTRGYAKHFREVQTLQKNGQTYNERNYLKKASVPYIFEDGRDIVKQSYTESQKHWASKAGI
ncbi:unnamed protein product [Mytilus coruscus]|uniref:Integrase zinc-binding domain-containing protein n=1 Tax=Mytilus coruscus TaxID=42192 RepID=A0A6J8BNZ2_MYTCO|nr:unnamed protein product [Mytilus coruscus]